MFGKAEEDYNDLAEKKGIVQVVLSLTFLISVSRTQACLILWKTKSPEACPGAGV